MIDYFARRDLVGGILGPSSCAYAISIVSSWLYMAPLNEGPPSSAPILLPAY